MTVTAQYGNMGFQVGDTKLEIFLPKNQHTQRGRSQTTFANFANF